MRVRMTLAYNGRGFRGFAVQPGVTTVGGTLTRALERVLGHPVELTCAGRTDAGVHAWGQVVSFEVLDAPDAAEEGADKGPEVELSRLQRSLNRMLSPALVVRSLEPAPAGFDARRSARARRYRYTVLNRALPDPFLAGTTWHVEAPLDLASMRLACDPVIGEHDFTSFCRIPSHLRTLPAEAVTLVRRVHDARWVDLGDGRLRFDVEASSFCQQMVRSLVGTMVAVGLGRRRAGGMGEVLLARHRQAASEPAPPWGLCLWEVVY